MNEISINHRSPILQHLISLQATFTSNIEDIGRRGLPEKQPKKRVRAQQATAALANKRKTVRPDTGQKKHGVSLILGQKWIIMMISLKHALSTPFGLGPYQR